MKKRFSILFALSGVALLAGCSPNAGEAPNSSGEAATSSIKDSSEIAEPDYGSNNVIVHFYGKGLDYSKYALWLWKKGGDGKEYLFKGEDSYGAYASVPISTFGTDLKTIVMGTIVKTRAVGAGKRAI